MTGVWAINGKLRTLIILLLCIMLAACRRQGAQGPTLQPTLTTTPRSTPLPSLEPTIAPGESMNPVRMTIVRPGGVTRDTELNRAVEDVATALLEETGLIVDVELVDSDADGVAALCDVNGAPAVVWVSGLGYGVAAAEGCGTPALMIERGTGRTVTTGETVQIIVNSESEITDVSGLVEQSFCRLGYDDVYTWLVPNMMLRAAGITAIPEAVEQENIETLIQAVADGDCDAAGVSAADFEQFGGDAEDSVRALNRTVTIPYAIFMYPPTLPLEVRTELLDGLLAMSESGDMETLLDQSSIVSIEGDELSDLDAFLASTGIDFAQLGS